MKRQIEILLTQAIESLKSKSILDSEITPVIKIMPTNTPQHGDFSTNLAFILSKAINIMNPHMLAEKIIESLPPSAKIAKVEIAKPGFINFFLATSSYQTIVASILKAGNQYGQSKIGKGQHVHLEYVSANPTGPLHVGHGRGAAYGACVANLLKAVGFKVHREYYVNDAGRQISILTLSVWVRYLQSYEAAVDLPKNAYQGQYIIDIAQELKAKYGKQFFRSPKFIKAKIHEMIGLNDNPEVYLDASVAAQKVLLGKEGFKCVFHVALDNILNDIKNDLEEFHVIYDAWFHESRLIREGLLQEGFELLTKNGYIYQNNSAQWFRATVLGDTKDRVLIRKNGTPTYFFADVAYHLYKFNQGYDQIIDIFGADHHGYIPRIRAFLKGLGKSPEKLHTLLVQFATLYRGDEKVSMSTREGTFVTLRELRQEVGNDAARFFYIIRKPNQHLDFDLELAKSKSNKNPVYYIQYAYARICSVFRQLKTTRQQWDRSAGVEHLYLLSNCYEKDLLIALASYPEIIQNAATNYAPHLLAYYLQTLANQFHTYYNAERFLTEDDNLRNARLSLISSVQQVILNGLTLLDICTTEEM